MEKKRWYNNGVREICCFEADKPEGEEWVLGRLPRSWENNSKHMRENNPMWTMTEEEKKARAEKLHNYNLNKTEEQKKHKSEAISKAKKDKYKGSIPWNKGLKGVQEARNKGKTLSEEQKKQISETKRNKSEEEKAEISRKLSESLKGRIPWNKGIATGPWSEERRASALPKEIATKAKNHSFNTSSLEEELYEFLKTQYAEEDILRQYSDERYPFACDFYIKSADLFIELNAHWTHGGHPFDSSSEEDLALLERWKQQAEKSVYYQNAIKTWTYYDVKKQECARNNNLNYKALYEGDF